MQVNLFKRRVPYVDQKDGKEKIATNFFVSCGDILVPVEVKYFENKETGRDDRYMERKTLLSAFADTLPERPKKDEAQVSAPVTVQTAVPAEPNNKAGQALKVDSATGEVAPEIPF